MKIWDPLYECMPREDLEQLQLERLQATLNRVYKSVTCYKKKFDEAGINPEEIRSLADLAQLPFTTKEDLRLNYPYGMFAVPLREVVRIHSSSGTTGKPTVVGYTKNDIHTWSNLVARFMTAAGVTHDDVVQIAFGYGMFTGAFGLHYGSETIGASVIPMGAGNTEKQIMIMQDYKIDGSCLYSQLCHYPRLPHGAVGDRSEIPVAEGRAVRWRALVRGDAQGN